MVTIGNYRRGRLFRGKVGRAMDYLARSALRYEDSQLWDNRAVKIKLVDSYVPRERSR